jgi:hypothetical protein
LASSALSNSGRQPDQPAHRRIHLAADDHSHDDESGFHRDSGSGQETQRSAGHTVRELDGQTIFHGFDFLLFFRHVFSQ